MQYKFKNTNKVFIDAGVFEKAISKSIDTKVSHSLKFTPNGVSTNREMILVVFDTEITTHEKNIIQKLIDSRISDDKFNF